MKDLVFLSPDKQALTSSKIIAEEFDKMHKNVLRAIDDLKCSEEFKRLNFELIDNQQVIGDYSPAIKEREYAITRDGFMFLVMGFTGDKAAKSKEDFIKAFNEMEKQLSNPYGIPQSLSEALYLAAEQAQKIEEQSKYIEEAKPKVDFFDAVADSKDAIEMAAVAKVLNRGIGRNRLFEFLRSKGVLLGNNQPAQRYIDAGYFRTIEQKFTKNDGSVNINIKTLVYQKGVNYIKRLLDKE